MNSKKLWSLLLLIAMSFSLVHDYAFVALDKDNHFVNEYISDIMTPSSGSDELTHQLHSEFHVFDLHPTRLISIGDVQKEKSLFIDDEIFLSLSYSNFLKPPIA